METTRMSSKGQVIIPKSVRQRHQWDAGQELMVVDVGDGVLLKAKRPFPPTTMDEVAGFLKYDGPAKTIEEMELAIAAGAGTK